MSKARRRRKPRPPTTPASHESFACASSAPAADLGELPTVLNGRYRLERLLGIGGMGSVHRARDLLWEQFGEPSPWVAVKLLNEEFATIPDASALLYSEYALAVRLRHPAIVRLHAFEVDTACRRAFITQELLKGLPWITCSATVRPGCLGRSCGRSQCRCSAPSPTLTAAVWCTAT